MDSAFPPEYAQYLAHLFSDTTAHKIGAALLAFVLFVAVFGALNRRKRY